MPPLRYVLVLAVCCISLISIAVVSYYELVDLDKISVETHSCAYGCAIAVGDRCFRCRSEPPPSRPISHKYNRGIVHHDYDDLDAAFAPKSHKEFATTNIPKTTRKGEVKVTVTPVAGFSTTATTAMRNSSKLHNYEVTSTSRKPLQLNITIHNHTVPSNESKHSRKTRAVLTPLGGRSSALSAVVPPVAVPWWSVGRPDLGQKQLLGRPMASQQQYWGPTASAVLQQTAGQQQQLYWGQAGVSGYQQLQTAGQEQQRYWGQAVARSQKQLTGLAAGQQQQYWGQAAVSGSQKLQIAPVAGQQQQYWGQAAGSGSQQLHSAPAASQEQKYWGQTAVAGSQQVQSGTSSGQQATIGSVYQQPSTGTQQPNFAPAAGQEQKQFWEQAAASGSQQSQSGGLSAEQQSVAGTQQLQNGGPSVGQEQKLAQTSLQVSAQGQNIQSLAVQVPVPVSYQYPATQDPSQGSSAQSQAALVGAQNQAADFPNQLRSPIPYQQSLQGWIQMAPSQPQAMPAPIAPSPFSGPFEQAYGVRPGPYQTSQVQGLAAQVAPFQAGKAPAAQFQLSQLASSTQLQNNRAPLPSQYETRQNSILGQYQTDQASVAQIQTGQASAALSQTGQSFAPQSQTDQAFAAQSQIGQAGSVQVQTDQASSVAQNQNGQQATTLYQTSSVQYETWPAAPAAVLDQLPPAAQNQLGQSSDTAYYSLQQPSGTSVASASSNPGNSLGLDSVGQFTGANSEDSAEFISFDYQNFEAGGSENSNRAGNKDSPSIGSSSSIVGSSSTGYSSDRPPASPEGNLSYPGGRSSFDEIASTGAGSSNSDGTNSSSKSDIVPNSSGSIRATGTGSSGIDGFQAAGADSSSTVTADEMAAAAAEEKAAADWAATLDRLATTYVTAESTKQTGADDVSTNSSLNAEAAGQCDRSTGSTDCKTPRLASTNNFPCPKVCDKSYVPVCGTDGKSYANECMLRLKACETGDHGMKLAHLGLCPQDRGLPTQVGAQAAIDSRPGVSQSTNTSQQKVTTTAGSNIETTNSNKSATIIDIKIISADSDPGSRPQLSTSPPPISQQLSSTTSTSLPSVSLPTETSSPNTERPTTSITPAPTTSKGPRAEQFTEEIDDVVGSDEHPPSDDEIATEDTASNKKSSSASSTEGKAAIPSCDPRACSKVQNYDPVCGTDGKTYDNECSLRQTRCFGPAVDLEFVGPCIEDVCSSESQCSGAVLPVCGTDGQNYINTCMLKRVSCWDKEQKEAVTVWHRGWCGDCSMVCSSIGSPVCGSDWKTYRNSCTRELESCRAGVPVRDLHDGPCSSGNGGPPANEITTRTPRAATTSTRSTSRDPLMALFDTAKNRYDTRDQELSWHEELTK